MLRLLTSNTSVVDHLAIKNIYRLLLAPALGLQLHHLSTCPAVHTAALAQQASNAPETATAPVMVRQQDSAMTQQTSCLHESTYSSSSELQHLHICSGPLGMGAYTAVVAAVIDSYSKGSSAAEAATWQLLHLLQQNSAATTHEQREQLERGILQAVHQLTGAVLPPQQLLPTLHATQQLQQPPSQLLNLLTSSVVEVLPQLTPSQLADVLTALSTCHSSSNSSRSSPKALPKKAVLQKAVSKYLQQHQQQFDAASTAAVATALASETYQQSSSFTLLSMLVLDHMQAMSAQQLTDVLVACAKVQHYNQAVMDAAAQVAIQTLKQQGYRLLQEDQVPQQQVQQQQPTQQVQQHPYLADSEATDQQQQEMLATPNTLDQQQQQQRSSRAAGFTCTSLAELLNACSSLRHHHPELLNCAAMATLRSRSAMQLHQVVRVVAACAFLNHYNMPLFDEACRLAQQAMAEQQQQQKSITGTSSSSDSRSSSTDSASSNAGRGANSNHNSSNCGSNSSASLSSILTDLAWSCAIMNHLDPVYFQAVATWALKHLKVEQLHQQQLLQWFEVQSCLTDGAVLQPELRTVGLPNSLLIATQAAWMQQLSGQQSITGFHKEVHEALRQAGRRCRLNVALDGPYVVDVVLLQRPGSRIKMALQLETPEMFASNAPYAALGPTAAKWRALQTRGWQVLSLRYSDWVRLRTPEDRVRYMWHLKEASAVRTPLAPDVVQAVGSRPGAGRSKQQQSLTQQLWRLLVDA